MSYEATSLLSFSAAALLLIAVAGLFFAARGNTLPALRRFCRWRWPGIVFGIPALLWCVPHARAVAPESWAVAFIPLAIIVPILGYFVLDHITSRVIGGALIIAAYETIQRAFALAVPGYGFIIVLAWLYGLAGIWISGVPWSLRDALARAADKPRFKFAVAGFASLAALSLIWAAIHVA